MIDADDQRAARLIMAREHVRLSREQAAERLGMSIAVLRSHERAGSGRASTGRAYSPDQAADYGRLYKVPPEWLLFGRNAPEWAWIRIISEVGAGAEVFPLEEPFDDIEPPPGAHQDAFGLRVRGDSMSPAMSHGDILICEWRDNPQMFIGKTVVADLEDGRRLVKRLARGPRSGTFTLIGHDASMIEGAKLVRIAEIIWHKPT